MSTTFTVLLPDTPENLFGPANVSEKINNWFANKGVTLINKEHEGAFRWTFTVSETLDAGQRDTLKTAIENVIDRVKFQ